MRFQICLLALALTACANKAQDSIEMNPAYVSATQKLNSRDFEGAVSELEALAAAQPQSMEVKRKLMHALAGASGFDAVTFKGNLERLSDKLEKKAPFREAKDELEDFRRQYSINKLNRAMVRKFRKHRLTRGLKEMMEDAPTLNSVQYQRLDRALKMYEELGFSYETSSPEDNFQWGVLYSYRILANLKHVANTLDELAREDAKDRRIDLEKYAIGAASQLGHDSFQAYKLFRHSYSKLQRIALKVEEFVEKVTGEETEAKVLAEAKNTEELVRFLVARNKEIVSDLIAQIEDKIESGNFEQGLRQAFSEFENESPEVRYRKDRIRAIVRVYLEEFENSHEAQIAEAKSIITPALVAEVKAALKEAVRIRKADPVLELKRDHRSEFHRLLEIGSFLLDEAKNTQIKPELKEHALALRDRVDKEQLKIIRDDAKRTIDEVGDLLEGGKAKLLETEEYAKRKFAQRGRAFKKIGEELLEQDLKEIEEEAQAPDPELEKGAEEAGKKARKFLR